MAAMTFETLPPTAAWRHIDARAGFEVVFPHGDAQGTHLEGYTSAVEDGATWAVRYAITLDDRWRTTVAHVHGRSAGGERTLHLERDGAGRWLVDGRLRADLDGCLDVDLESSACTNTVPLHRLDLAVGDAADAPAVYVRAEDLGVMRLEQRYQRLDDDGDHLIFDYDSPAFDTHCHLRFDRTGLVVAYPGLARRAA